MSLGSDEQTPCSPGWTGWSRVRPSWSLYSSSEAQSRIRLSKLTEAAKETVTIMKRIGQWGFFFFFFFFFFFRILVSKRLHQTSVDSNTFKASYKSSSQCLVKEGTQGSLRGTYREMKSKCYAHLKKTTSLLFWTYNSIHGVKWSIIYLKLVVGWTVLSLKFICENLIPSIWELHLIWK